MLQSRYSPITRSNNSSFDHGCDVTPTTLRTVVEVVALPGTGALACKLKIPSGTGIFATSNEDQPPMSSAMTAPPLETVKRNAPPVPPLSTQNGPCISFPLPAGNLIEVRLRSKISSKEFETVKRLIELSEASLVEESTSDE